MQIHYYFRISFTWHHWHGYASRTPLFPSACSKLVRRCLNRSCVQGHHFQSHWAAKHRVKSLARCLKHANAAWWRGMYHSLIHAAYLQCQITEWYHPASQILSVSQCVLPAQCIKDETKREILPDSTRKTEHSQKPTRGYVGRSPRFQRSIHIRIQLVVFLLCVCIIGKHTRIRPSASQESDFAW